MSTLTTNKKPALLVHRSLNAPNKTALHKSVKFIMLAPKVRDDEAWGGNLFGDEEAEFTHAWDSGSVALYKYLSAQNEISTTYIDKVFDVFDTSNRSVGAERNIAVDKLDEGRHKELAMHQKPERGQDLYLSAGGCMAGGAFLGVTIGGSIGALVGAIVGLVAVLAPAFLSNTR